MIFGNDPLTLTHVAISFVGIASGIIVLFGMLANKRLDRWTVLFLASTIATSVTGFVFFPFVRLLASHITGIISLVALAAAIYARYPKRMAGTWRRVYVFNAVASLYLNVFVLVVQLFLKVPGLKALAPTQSEPPFAIAQLVVLIAFLAAGAAATKRFQPHGATDT